MNYLQMIAELENLVNQLGIKLRYEKGDFEGGYCVVKEQKVLVVNKKLHEMRRASILAQALHEIGIEHLFIKPVVRQYIEDEVVKISKQRS